MPHLPIESVPVATGATLHARILVLVCGLSLCAWTVIRLRDRKLLVSICGLFLAIGASLVVFSAVPSTFDAVSYAMGIKYPPLLYLMAALFALMLVIIHLAARLSLLDERNRRLTQELALMKHDKPESGADRP